MKDSENILEENYIFEASIVDESKNNRLIIETISKFILNYY